MDVDVGTRMQNIAHDHPQQQRNRRQNLKVDQGLNPDSAKLLNVADIGNPYRQARDYDRHYNHLDQPQKDRTEALHYLDGASILIGHGPNDNP